MVYADSEELKKLITEDIKKCDDFLHKKEVDPEELRDFMANMYSKYSFLGYDDILNRRIIIDFIWDGEPKSFDSVKKTVLLFKGFLESSNATAKTILSAKAGEKSITNASLTANLNNSVDIDISIDAQIEQLIGNIKNNGYLDDKSKAEILANIEEIKKVLDSSDSKTEKWSKLKDRVLWAVDQGVEIGAAVLNIISKVV